MAHRTSKGFTDYESEAANISKRVSDVLREALEFYNEFQRDLNSRSLIQFAIDINKTAHSGTAQAGTSTTITLATDAVPTDDEYNFLDIRIDGGTGAGQDRTISDYVGSTRVATVSVAWTTTPDATSTYKIAHRAVHEINSAHGASKEAFDHANNVASPTQGDRFYAWRALS